MTDQMPGDRKYSEAIGGAAITGAATDAVLIRDLPEGTHVRIRNGDIVEITANPRDGGWLFVKVLESSETSRIGADDMAFCIDVIDVIKHVDQ